MADLVLEGNLNLVGDLTLQGSGGGKVKVGSAEVLAELASPPSDPAHGTASPVILPPPPAPPADSGPNVWVINSFNKTVKVKASTGPKPIVALGLVMQGQIPMWPGMVLPSQGNTTAVRINQIAINVAGDQAVIFPSGGTANLTTSGQ